MRNKDEQKTLRREEDTRRNVAEISCGQTAKPTRRPLGAAEAAAARSIDSPLHSGMLRMCGHAEPLTQFWGAAEEKRGCSYKAAAWLSLARTGREGRRDGGAGRARSVHNKAPLAGPRTEETVSGSEEQHFTNQRVT